MKLSKLSPLSLLVSLTLMSSVHATDAAVDTTADTAGTTPVSMEAQPSVNAWVSCVHSLALASTSAEVRRPNLRSLR